jgi:glycosyltransferase involved in cell wall biosynthesis
MKLALLSPDDRERFKRYDLETPIIPAVETALLEGLAAQRDLEVHYISCLQAPVRSPKKIADNIWFHSLHVPKTGWMRTFYHGCTRAIRRQLQEIQPDIVHGQGSERECAISAARSGFPNVVTIHGNMKALAEFYRARIGSFYWLAGKLETWTLGKTMGVFCNSTYTEEMVAPRAKKTWRVPNAVRSPFFRPFPEPPKNDRPVLLNVGVLAPYKRQREILAMAQRLWQRGLRFEIRFAGALNPTSPYDAAFSRELAEAEATGYARHLGELPMDGLIAAMDAADAMVHFPTEESFGLVVAEALARNLKLFAAAVGGITDIASGVDGVELTNDFTTLENSIATWIGSEKPRPVTAAKTMRERYHPAVIAARHMEIYREVLGRH